MRKSGWMVAAALALGAAPAALAAMTNNTVAPKVALAEKGRTATVGVVLGCDREERARLRVTVNQSAPDAGLAEGRRTVACTTERKTFPVRAAARRQSALGRGAATVCVLATMADDTRQWCKEVTVG